MNAQAIDIKPGEHIEWHVFGLTLNGDTISATLVSGVLLLAIVFLVRSRLSVRQPGKLQLGFEMVTQYVEDQVESQMGIKTAPWVVPLAECLFLFILFANWLALVPTGHHPEYLPPPAADVNLTYALALVVIITMHITGIKRNGLRYYAHIFEKPRLGGLLILLRIIEEIVRPVTLALRLFGNIFAGTIMVSLIAALPAFILWAPNIIWKIFDMGIGAIQAFIFALLTILYLSSIKPHEAHTSHTSKE